MAKFVLALVALAMAACGTSTGSGSVLSPRTNVASASRIASSAPSPDTSAARQVAIDGAVKATGATYIQEDVDVITACPANVAKCLVIQGAVVGVHAVYFRARVGSSKGSAACFLYTIQNATGWHFLDLVCAGPESGVSWPDVGSFDYVFVSPGSCANVRATPGLGGKIVACLPAGMTVNIDGGPEYVVEPPPAVSHLWWHIQGKGWMAHDFLIPS